MRRPSSIGLARQSPTGTTTEPATVVSTGTSQEGRRIAVRIACHSHRVAGCSHRFVPRTWAYGTISYALYTLVCPSIPHDAPMLITLVWSQVQAYRK